MVAQDNVALVYVSDIDADDEGNLWFLSNRLPILMKGSFNESEVNFRIFSVPVSLLIKDSVCDRNRSAVKLPVTTVTYY